MDENLQELENELKRLPPQRLSARLMASLEDELGPSGAAVSSAPAVTSSGHRPWRWVAWSLASAAGLALLALLQLSRQPAGPAVEPSREVTTASNPAPHSPSVTPVNRYEPVHASSVLYEMKEDGAALLTDQTEGRRVRYRYLDTYTWKNPASNASLRWSVPRDEVRVIRASLD
jgi:hypothetical protein